MQGTGGALTATKTVYVWSSAVNNPPSITRPATISVDEEATLGFTGGNTISITDTDAFGAGSEKVTLSVLHGTVTANGQTGSTVTLTGTLSQINGWLGAMTYKGNTDYNGADTLTIASDDQGNTGAGTGTDTKTVAITVNPVNDTPTITVPGTQTLATGTQFTIAGHLRRRRQGYDAGRHDRHQRHRLHADHQRAAGSQQPVRHARTSSPPARRSPAPVPRR